MQVIPAFMVRKFLSWVDPEEGRGPYRPPENYNNKGFLSKTGPDPLKNYKATKPEFNVGPSLARLETPFV